MQQPKIVPFSEHKPPPKQNLPLQPTTLIGREQETATLLQLLHRPDVRLLTLTGTPGIGKTRLALHVATKLVPDFADGVYFVPLAPIFDPDLAAPTIAQTLELKETAHHSPLDILKSYLQDKQLLLLLDNFEQIMRSAPLLEELLATCPALKMLVTSREVLRLRVERHYPVPPLSIPDLSHLPNSDALSTYAAVALFLARAQVARPDFQMTRSNAPAIAEICVRLEGLPLAIELAATRVKLLSPQELLPRLGSRLQLLSAKMHELPERQRTLRNTIQWSYDLLTPQEQRLFRQLAIFVGGCSVEAVEQVCTPLEDGELDLLDGLTSLLDKSLLQRREQSSGETRLMMLEMIREYGLERLAAHDEMEAIHQAHATYYLQLAKAAEPEFFGPNQPIWLARLEREHANLRMALQRFVEREEMEQAAYFAAALNIFWFTRCHFSEGRNFLEHVLTWGEKIPAAARAKVLLAACMLDYAQGKYRQAQAFCEACLLLFQQLADTTGILDSLGMLINTTRSVNDYPGALSWCEKMITLSIKIGNRLTLADGLSKKALVLYKQGDLTGARRLSEESLTITRTSGDTMCRADDIFELALVTHQQGDLLTARSLAEESLALFKEVGSWRHIAGALRLLGEIALCSGDDVQAQSLLTESWRINNEVEDQFGKAFVLRDLGWLAYHRGEYELARTHQEQSMALFKEIEDRMGIAYALEGIALVDTAEGYLHRAVLLLGAAEQVRESITAPLLPYDNALYESALVTLHTRLGKKGFAQALAEGRRMTPEQALATRQALDSAAQIQVICSDGLTAREVEVLRLVAQGLTDAQVAEKLVISPRTVHSHLSSIYSKLAITSRSAATRYALEHKLV